MSLINSLIAKAFLSQYYFFVYDFGLRGHFIWTPRSYWSGLHSLGQDQLTDGVPL